MLPERAKELFVKTGAIIDGHFVGTSGSHMSVYVAKDRATRFPGVTSELCFGIAEMFCHDYIDAVVSPAVGGIALAQWTAHHISWFHRSRPEVLALYSEHDEDILYEYNDDVILVSRPDTNNQKTIKKGDKTILRRANFVLKRGFDKDVRGKNVLVVEDILTTGGSAAQTVKAVDWAGGVVIGLGALVNGGDVAARACGVPKLYTLTNINREIFTEEECADHGLCAKGIKINTEFGHGKEFLARKTK